MARGRGVAEPEVLEGEKGDRVAKFGDKCAGFSRGLGGRNERECLSKGLGFKLKEDYYEDGEGS